MLTAVAVWPTKPTPDQLLQRRLEDGWEPTATPLQSGPAFLGHAACLVGQPPEPGSSCGPCGR
ncbi:MAG: hypothetical protein L0Z62_47425 [Gemmataceae bacterium]|nr:hypothetical protein [Gemmataceae bacterium]